MPNFNLSGKNILVIGSSRGLGEHLAIYLKNNGVNVIGLSRTRSKENFKQLEIDISNKKDLSKLGVYLTKNSIKLDGVVLNSSISSDPRKSDHNEINKLELQNVDEFIKIIDVNLIGLYLTIREIIPFLVEGSSIVGISSIGAQLGFPNNPAYQASKAGLDAFMRSLAVDLSALKVRANHINLGYFKGPMTKKSYDDPELNSERSNRTIIARWGELDEFIGPVVFLLSEASSYITASGINVDGGWRAKGL